jgi:hypothetical protein
MDSSAQVSGGDPLAVKKAGELPEDQVSPVEDVVSIMRLL